MNTSTLDDGVPERMSDIEPSALRHYLSSLTKIVFFNNPYRTDYVQVFDQVLNRVELVHYWMVDFSDCSGRMEKAIYLKNLFFEAFDLRDMIVKGKPKQKSYIDREEYRTAQIALHSRFTSK